MEMRDLLCGEDRRSPARSGEALAIARQDPGAVEELAELTRDEDELISARACDVLAKLAQEHPDWVSPYKRAFLNLIESRFWEVRLHCVRAIPLFEWTAEEAPEVIEALRKHIDDEQKFVRCWSLNSFALFAETYDSLRNERDEKISEFLGSGIPSLQARARAIVRRLNL